LRPANFSSNRNAALHACSLGASWPCTSIIKLYAVCFWIRDSQRYSKASYISAWNKLWLYCGSLTCAAATLSLLQGNNLSNSLPHRVKCRTEAVKHLSRSLETWNMLKIILSKLKLYKLTVSVIPHQTSVSTSTWLCVAYHPTWKAHHTKRDKHHFYFWNPTKYKT